MPTAEIAPVVATTPFLTVPQTAGELRTDPIHVLRLIARRKLRAIRAGDGIADFKVLPADLASYSNAGAPDFERIALDSKNGDFDEAEHNHLRGTAADFEIALRREIAKMLPDEFTDLPTATQKSLRLNLGLLPQFARLCEQPVPAGIVRFAEGQTDREQFGRLWLEWYAVATFRMYSRTVTASSPVEVIRASRLEKLYGSPESYGSVVDYCREKWAANSLTCRSSYPAESWARDGAMRTVVAALPHKVLPVDLNRIAQLAF